MLMYSTKLKSYLFIGLSIIILCLVVLLFSMMENGESKEIYTNGAGYALLSDESNASPTKTLDVKTMPIGTVFIDNKVQAVAMLSRKDKKVNFSKIKCLKDIRRKFVQIHTLGSYPLDAGLNMLKNNLDMLEDFGKQWGRPVPDTVMDLFRKFIPAFTIWATAPGSQKSERSNIAVSGKFRVSFGMLSQNTYLYFFPFKHGGSLGPVEYTGKMEPALFITGDRHKWILPYTCGNGPAEIILPCKEFSGAVLPPENNAIAENGSGIVADVFNQKTNSVSPLYADKNTGSPGNNSSVITSEPSIWIPDTNGGGSSGYSSNTPSSDDNSKTSESPDSTTPDSPSEPELPVFPIVIKPDTGNDIPPIPEPATWLTMTLGLLFLTRIRKK